MTEFDTIVYGRETDIEYIATGKIWAEDDIEFELKKIIHYVKNGAEYKALSDNEVNEEIYDKFAEEIHEYAIGEFMKDAADARAEREMRRDAIMEDRAIDRF